MPSMNPDGFELGIRYNANGVDLNRDLGFLIGLLSSKNDERSDIREWPGGHSSVTRCKKPSLL